jgi:hypothetical protein
MFPCIGPHCRKLSPCSLGLLATSQQYFSLTTNQPPATSQQCSSLRTNQHQPSATSQPNRLFVGDYSYSKIVSSHEMFEKVQRCLNLVVCDFRMVKNGALSFLRCLNEFMIGDIFEMKGRAVS